MDVIEPPSNNLISKPDPATAERRVIAKLSKENERLQRQLKKAHIIIDVQKKLCEVLEIPIHDPHQEEIS